MYVKSDAKVRFFFHTRKQIKKKSNKMKKNGVRTGRSNPNDFAYVNKSEECEIDYAAKLRINTLICNFFLQKQKKKKKKFVLSKLFAKFAAIFRDNCEKRRFITFYKQ